MAGAAGKRSDESSFTLLWRLKWVSAWCGAHQAVQCWILDPYSWGHPVGFDMNGDVIWVRVIFAMHGSGPLVLLRGKSHCKSMHNYNSEMKHVRPAAIRMTMPPITTGHESLNKFMTMTMMWMTNHSLSSQQISTLKTILKTSGRFWADVYDVFSPTSTSKQKKNIYWYLWEECFSIPPIERDL